MNTEITKDGYKRVVHADSVDWYINRRGSCTYCVARFPFVPGYHICVFTEAEQSMPTEYPLQTFKTLTEALAILRVLDANTENNDG